MTTVVSPLLTDLVPVMRNGKRVAPPPPLVEIRGNVAAQSPRLSGELRGLEPANSYPVQISPALRALTAQLDRDATFSAG